jgi:pantoate--beta-alanine ligase
MKAVRVVEELRSVLSDARSGGASVGLVPTMGALHDGHLSLIRRARDQCDEVVVSVFVNPTQFDQRADLDRYPRDEARDRALAADAGADVLFAPSAEEVYPPGFATAVEVSGVSERLEGAARGSAHFRGVATVVAKLLAIVQPDVAYFGQKDAQQVVVIRRLVTDLNLPVRIEALATVRDADGLALSSRNALLTASQRERALALPTALTDARALIAAGVRSGEAIVAAAERALRAREVEIDYVALVDPDTFEELSCLDGDGLLAIAGRVGSVRLIDNTPVSALPAQRAGQPDTEEVTTCNA